MKYTNQILNHPDIVGGLKQINKTVAKKLFSEGVTVYLHPCNMAFTNKWGTPCPINKNREEGNEFDKIVDSFEMYNCIQELGKYANFFIKV